MTDSAAQYEILDLIGAGGMAEVYRARWVSDRGGEQVVALKRLLPHMSDDTDCVNRFVDEAQIMVRLNHPNICQILDFGTMRDGYFITMEYVEGLDVAAVTRLLDRTDDRVPIDVALYVVSGVLSGLHYAHCAEDETGQPLKVVHRDVSPHNVLLGVNGDVKLTDLGAATASDRVRTTQTSGHAPLGKLLYMAPEQRQGNQLDGRADVYSVGLILAEMLLGASEFHDNASGFLAGLFSWSEKLAANFAPPWDLPLSQMVERSLAPDPEQRFQSAGEMLAMVTALVEEFGRPATPERVGNLVAQLLRRRAGKPEEALDLAPRCPRISSVVSLYSEQGQEVGALLGADLLASPEALDSLSPRPTPVESTPVPVSAPAPFTPDQPLPPVRPQRPSRHSHVPDWTDSVSTVISAEDSTPSRRSRSRGVRWALAVLFVLVVVGLGMAVGVWVADHLLLSHGPGAGPSIRTAVAAMTDDQGASP